MSQIQDTPNSPERGKGSPEKTENDVMNGHDGTFAIEKGQIMLTTDTEKLETDLKTEKGRTFIINGRDPELEALADRPDSREATESALKFRSDSRTLLTSFSRNSSRIGSRPGSQCFQTEVIIATPSPTKGGRKMSSVYLATSQPALEPLISEDGEEEEEEEEDDYEDYGDAAADDPDSGWDTDLEIEDEKVTYDLTGKTLYVEACKELGVVPVSYFIRNMQNPNLSLNHHGLGSAGARAIAVPLVSNTSVLKLDLEDNWLGPEGAHYIADMLKENCYITDLNIANNRIGSEGLCAICDMLSFNVNVKKINLSGNRFQDKDAEVMASLILENNRISELDLSHNEFSEQAGEMLGHAIGENETLERLDLSWNHLRLKGAAAICEGIKVNPRLKRFNMAWNGLGNEGAYAMAEALKQNSTLVELDISNNRITVEGCTALAKGLNQNETLKILKIGQNPLTPAGAMTLLTAIHNERNVLTEFYMNDVLVEKEFDTLHKEILQSREIKIVHGGIIGNYVLKEGRSKRNRARGGFGTGDDMDIESLEDYLKNDPMAVLKSYVERKNFRLVDLFNQFDKDKSMTLTMAEFKKGVMEADIGLSESQLDTLLDRLDNEGNRDGLVDYQELVEGNRRIAMKQRLLKRLKEADAKKKK